MKKRIAALALTVAMVGGVAFADNAVIKLNLGSYDSNYDVNGAANTNTNGNSNYNTNTDSNTNTNADSGYGYGGASSYNTGAFSDYYGYGYGALSNLDGFYNGNGASNSDYNQDLTGNANTNTNGASNTNTNGSSSGASSTDTASLEVEIPSGTDTSYNTNQSGLVNADDTSSNVIGNLANGGSTVYDGDVNGLFVSGATNTGYAYNSTLVGDDFLNGDGMIGDGVNGSLTDSIFGNGSLFKNVDIAINGSADDATINTSANVITVGGNTNFNALGAELPGGDN